MKKIIVLIFCMILGWVASVEAVSTGYWQFTQKKLISGTVYADTSTSKYETITANGDINAGSASISANGTAISTPYDIEGDTSWTAPPSIINPGSLVNIHLNANITGSNVAYVNSNWPLNCYMFLWVDTPGDPIYYTDNSTTPNVYRPFQVPGNIINAAPGAPLNTTASGYLNPGTSGAQIAIYVYSTFAIVQAYGSVQA